MKDKSCKHDTKMGKKPEKANPFAKKGPVGKPAPAAPPFMQKKAGRGR